MKIEIPPEQLLIFLNNYERAKNIFNTIKWHLVRYEFDIESDDYMIQMIIKDNVSLIALIVIGRHVLSDQYMHKLKEIGYRLVEFGIINMNNWDCINEDILQYEDLYLPGL